jgi:hypothetical protein
LGQTIGVIFPPRIALGTPTLPFPLRGRARERVTLTAEGDGSFPELFRKASITVED